MPELATVEYFGRKIHRWTVGPSTFIADPARGARLMNWHLELRDGSIRDVIHWPEVQDLDDFPKIRGGNPILFPFCARTFDNGDPGYWRDTAGIRRPMPMHGFARQGSFSLSRLHERGFTVQLEPTREDFEIYPYRYEFSVSYRFAETSLTVELTLRNTDRQPIPWSAGHHFYFKLPWQDGTTRDAYFLRLAAGKAVRQTADGRLSAPEVMPAGETFASPLLPDRIHYALASPRVEFGPADGLGRVTLTCGTDAVPPEWLTVVTWTPDAAAPFYCIEPWMGPPNSPEHKTGYHLVKPGQSQRFVVEVAVA